MAVTKPSKTIIVYFKLYLCIKWTQFLFYKLRVKQSPFFRDYVSFVPPFTRQAGSLVSWNTEGNIFFDCSLSHFLPCQHLSQEICYTSFFSLGLNLMSVYLSLQCCLIFSIFAISLPHTLTSLNPKPSPDSKAVVWQYCIYHKVSLYQISTTITTRWKLLILYKPILFQICSK